MEFKWYLKMTFGWTIASIGFAIETLWIILTVDYLPIVLTFGGLSFVLMLISFFGFIVCILDFNNQKEIFFLKKRIKLIDKILAER